MKQCARAMNNARTSSVFILCLVDDGVRVESSTKEKLEAFYSSQFLPHEEK